VRIVRLANYVAPASGGLRTALRQLGAGYQAAGHEPVLIIPGSRPERRQTEQGLVITVPGPRVPGTGGYRAITARRPLRRLLDDLEPDRIEVSDRTTLRWTGVWARRRGVRSVMVSHDSLATLVRMFRPPGLPVRGLVDGLNRDTAQSYDVVVCTTAWAAAELQRRGVPAVLVIAGDGPQRRWLQAKAARLPVSFLGHIADRGLLASLLATADVVIAPGPAETFGLSALEALASGTPVVVNSRSALPEVIGPAGLAAEDRDAAYADAIERLMQRGVTEGRRLARARAERFDWPTAVDGFLAAHGLNPVPRRAAEGLPSALAPPGLAGCRIAAPH
jgi:alpha-1,6-mannosyltransferase